VAVVAVLAGAFGLFGRARIGSRGGTDGAGNIFPVRRRKTAPIEANTRRPLVLHISSDYTDGLGERVAHRNWHPTLAVNNLVEGAEQFDHVVFSLRRRCFPAASFLVDLGHPRREHVRVFAYGHFGLPLGIGLFHSFWVAARTIRQVLQAEQLRPDAVHAHRLTFDGIAGWLLARALGIPLFVSIRGEVERKTFKFKPTYRPLMRRIVARSTGVFYVSAWYAAELGKYTDVDPARAQLLPNLVNETEIRSKPDCTPTSFVTVFNLNIWRKKGLKGLLAAFAEASKRSPTLRLSIVGGGRPRSIMEVRGLIERFGLESAVRLEGALPNAAVRERMSESMALVLPSHNETFGMVYLEALFAGAPILYSRGTGIDGFLDDLQVGIAVDPGSVEEIARALTELATNNTRYRRAVVASAGELSNRFGRDQVLARYARVIRSGISSYPRSDQLAIRPSRL